MNRAKFLMIAMAAVCAVAPLYASADAASDAKKAIRAQYDRSDAAASRKDSKGVIAIYTKDRVSVTQNGSKGSIDSEKDQMDKVFQLAQSVTIKTTITSVSVNGSTATVRAKQTGLVKIQNPQTKQNTQLTIESVMEDTWVKSKGIWLEKRSVEKSSNTSSKVLN